MVNIADISVQILRSAVGTEVKTSLLYHFVTDPQDTGVLFFDFNRVLRLLQVSSCRSGRCLFWLYENVAAMPYDIRDSIST